MLHRCGTLHVGLAIAVMIIPVTTCAGDAVAWKAGDRGVTLQETAVMSGKTRLGAISAGTELSAEDVQGKWILVEAAVSGEANKRKGWVAVEQLGYLPSTLPSVFPRDMQGKWALTARADKTVAETLIVRESYLLWMRRADTVHFVPATALTGVTQSGHVGGSWAFHAAQFKVQDTIGAIGATLPWGLSDGGRQVVVERDAEVSKQGAELVLTVEPAETTVQGAAPLLPPGAVMTIEREGVHRIQIPREELRFRSLPPDRGR